MHHDDAGELLARYALGEQIVEPHLVPHVEKRRRLIEKQDSRLLRQGTRDRDPLLLSSGQLVHGSPGKLRQVALCENLAHDAPVRRARPHPPVLVRRSPHRDDVPNRETPGDLTLLRDDGERSRHSRVGRSTQATVQRAGLRRALEQASQRARARGSTSPRRSARGHRPAPPQTPPGSPPRGDPFGQRPLPDRLGPARVTCTETSRAFERNLRHFPVLLPFSFGSGTASVRA